MVLNRVNSHSEVFNGNRLTHNALYKRPNQLVSLKLKET